jgi:hypothetical protein
MFLRRYRTEAEQVKKFPQKKYLRPALSATDPEISLYSWTFQKKK